MAAPMEFWKLRQVQTPTCVARRRGGADATLGFAGLEAGLVPRPSHEKSTKKSELRAENTEYCSFSPAHPML